MFIIIKTEKLTVVVDAEDVVKMLNGPRLELKGIDMCHWLFEKAVAYSEMLSKDSDTPIKAQEVKVITRDFEEKLLEPMEKLDSTKLKGVWLSLKAKVNGKQGVSRPGYNDRVFSVNDGCNVVMVVNTDTSWERVMLPMKELFWPGVRCDRCYDMIGIRELVNGRLPEDDFYTLDEELDDVFEEFDQLNI